MSTRLETCLTSTWTGSEVGKGLAGPRPIESGRLTWTSGRPARKAREVPQHQPPQLAAHPGPRLPGTVLSEPDQQQPQQAGQDMGADAVLLAVKHGLDFQLLLELEPAPLDLARVPVLSRA